MVPAMRALILAALLVAAGTCSAFAADPKGTVNAGTVNAYTPQQMAHAKALVKKAGRNAVAVENVQDGNFFFVAIGPGGAYLATVTADGHVYFSDPHPIEKDQSVPLS